MHIILLHATRGLPFSEHIFLHSSCTGKLPFKNWGLFDRASSSWNNVKSQLDAVRWFYWCILSSTYFGYIRPSSGASDVKLQHVVFCTEFLDGWWSREPLRRSCVRCRWCRGSYAHHHEHQLLSCSTWFSAPSFWMVQRTGHHPHRTHDPRSASQDHHPSKNSVQKTTCCNLTSNAPDDGLCTRNMSS